VHILSLQILNQHTNIHETSYEHYKMLKANQMNLKEGGETIVAFISYLQL